jgi:hypothetical protein
METISDRPCSILESLEQSLQEVQLMRKGKLPKRSWHDLIAEIEKENRENEES